MMAQAGVLAASLILQLGLAAANTRRRLFTPGEMRFWGVAIFVAVELVMLGITA